MPGGLCSFLVADLKSINLGFESSGRSFQAADDEKRCQSAQAEQHGGRASQRPEQALAGVLAALAKVSRIIQALPEKLGDTERLSRPGRAIRQRRPLDGRRPRMQIRHSYLARQECLAHQLGLACEKIPEAMRDLRLAFLDVAHPNGGRISRPSEQIALGQHQEHRLSADLRSMTALLLQQAEKSAELGKIRIDLRCRRRGVNGQDQGVGIQGVQRPPASQQLVGHSTVAIHQDRVHPAIALRRARFGKWLEGYRIGNDLLQGLTRRFLVKPALQLAESLGKIREMAIENVFLRLGRLGQGA